MAPSNPKSPHGSSPSGQMKPMKILRRPADAAPGDLIAESSVAARVSKQVSQSVAAALERERERFEKSFAARQEALLEAVTDVLTTTLERVVHDASTREAVALADALTKLTPKPPEVGGVDEEQIRGAFTAAFVSTLLPGMQENVREMFSELSATVETGVKEQVTDPTDAAAKEVRRLADDVSAASDKAKAAVNVASARGDGARDPQAGMTSTPPGPTQEEVDQAAQAAIRCALDEGRVQDALRMCVGKSAIVRATAINGALDSGADPAELFKEMKAHRNEAVHLIALLATDLTDRTQARLSWLYELVTGIDDEESPGQEEFSEATVKLLRGVIDSLKNFAAAAALPPTQAKDIKLLVHVLNAQALNM